MESIKTVINTVTKSQSLPFYICDAIFNSISNAEIDAQVKRDYTVIQLDCYPHSPLAGIQRSELYKKGSRQ
jgi:hypothetical protein